MKKYSKTSGATLIGLVFTITSIAFVGLIVVSAAWYSTPGGQAHRYNDRVENKPHIK